MNMRMAFDETMLLARSRNMHIRKIPESLAYGHLLEMRGKIYESEMSDGKLGRWLGWAQAAVVAAGCGTLEEMKQINKRNS